MTLVIKLCKKCGQPFDAGIGRETICEDCKPFYEVLWDKNGKHEIGVNNEHLL